MSRWISGSWIGANLVFVLLHPSWMAAWPSPLRALGVGAVLLVVPAWGWSRVLGSEPRVPWLRVVRRAGLSSVLFVGLLALFRAAGATPTQAAAWHVIWIITNAGFALAAVRGRLDCRRRGMPWLERLVTAGLFAAAFALYFTGATRIVPPQEDHDLEVQATGYGLLTRFEPLLLTDRHTIYYFAHPPLLHVLVGGSFLYMGALPDLAFFDEASQRARNAREGRPVTPPAGSVPRWDGDTAEYLVAGVQPPNYTLTPVGGGPPEVHTIEDVELGLIYNRHRSDPRLIETRTPNVFLSAVVVALLGGWACRMSHRWWVGLLAAVAYATGPEVVVRSSYGGYYAIGALGTVAMLAAIEHWRRFPRWSRSGNPLAAGAMAALSDHKTVLVPVVASLAAFVSPSHAPSVSRAPGRQGLSALVSRLIHPVAAGFAIGLALFWCLGLAVAPAAFIEDHLHHHLFDRVAHINPLGYHNYPSPAALWAEFTRHTGYLLLPVGVLLLVSDAARLPRERARSLLWLGFIVTSGLVFTLVDWRMTKHLATLIPVLHLALVPGRHAPPWRVALPTAVMIGLIGWNLTELNLLVHDFAGFTISPAW